MYDRYPGFHMPNPRIPADRGERQFHVIIPYGELSPEALAAVIEEFVTRDGTELTDAQTKIEQVKRQLENGRIVITFDVETRTCNIAPSESASG